MQYVNKKHVRIQRGGGQGVRTPLKTHKNIGFLSKSGPDPLEKHKDTDPAFDVGPLSARQRNAISMAFRWQADYGPFLVAFRFSPCLQLKKKQKKNVVSVGPPLTKLSGSAHEKYLDQYARRTL